MMVSPFCPSSFSKHNSGVTEPVKQRKNMNQTVLYLFGICFLSLGSYENLCIKVVTDWYYFFCLVCQFRCQMHKHSSGCKRGRPEVDSDPRQWHRHQGKETLRGADVCVLRVRPAGSGRTLPCSRDWASVDGIVWQKNSTATIIVYWVPVPYWALWEKNQKKNNKKHTGPCAGE